MGIRSSKKSKSNDTKLTNPSDQVDHPSAPVDTNNSTDVPSPSPVVKNLPVLNNKHNDVSGVACECGSQMIRSTPSKGYANGVISQCESCSVTIETDQNCWHCPKGAYGHYPGFDYCLDCIVSGYSKTNPSPSKHGDFFLTDRDISIVLCYWYRICILTVNDNDDDDDIISFNQYNLPLTIIELAIIPYLYSKSGFEYQLTVGVLSINPDDVDSDLFIQEYLCNNNNAVKSKKIGIYDKVNIELVKLCVEEWNDHLNIKLPKRIHSLMDISIIIILYDKYNALSDNISLINKILSQLIQNSDEMYIEIASYYNSYVASYRHSYRGIIKIKKPLKTNPKSSPNKPKEIDIKMKKMKSDFLAKKKKINSKRIHINSADYDLTQNRIRSMIDHAAVQYIKNVEHLYKAL